MSQKRHCLLLLAALALAATGALAADPVRLVFVGDIMLDDGPGRLVSRAGDPLAPFAALLADAD